MDVKSFEEFLTVVGYTSDQISQRQINYAQRFYDSIINSGIVEPTWMLSSDSVLGFYWKDCKDIIQLYLSVDIDETGIGIFAFVENTNNKITMTSSGRVKPNGIVKIYNAFMIEE